MAMNVDGRMGTDDVAAAADVLPVNRELNDCSPLVLVPES
jgi:hypothetical protein